MPGTGWAERYLGGSKEAEDRLIEDWARRIEVVQRKLATANGRPLRALHAKAAAVVRASLRILPDGELDRAELAAAGFTGPLPAPLRAGLLAPGQVFDDVVVRFSNASGSLAADSAKDMRGVAVRVTPPSGRVQDLLMTNMAASFARDPEQQIGVTEANALSANRLTMIARLFAKFGPSEAVRILRTLSAVRPVETLAAEEFWSRAPFAVGPHAVKFKLQPRQAPEPSGVDPSPDYLYEDLKTRLATSALTYDLRLQFFDGEPTTPIEDGTVAWPTPFVTFGALVIPPQDLDSPDLGRLRAEIERTGFSPAHNETFTGIGSLNRARAKVYWADQRARGVT